MPNYSGHRHHLIQLAAHNHDKSQYNISAQLLKGFWEKEEKVKKT